MVFIGDIAFPFSSVTGDTDWPWGSEQVVVANLEGAIDTPDDAILQKKVVFNHPAVLRYLQALGVRAVSLANNHVFDMGPSLASTRKQLAREGIASVGAGSSLVHASRAVTVQTPQGPVQLMAFGWGPVECPSATLHSPGVNPLEPTHVLESIRRVLAEKPDVPVVLLMHWNYELERYPQPAHRQLAFAAIDAGASGVMGCHSHRVEGVEWYNGAPVVYGLGNWFFPHGIYFGGRTSFPDVSLLRMAFEWTPGASEAHVHWFTYQPDGHTLTYCESEETRADAPPAGASRLSRHTPYAGLSHKAYVSFFSRKRVKRKLLPIYRDIEAHAANRLRDTWVRTRGQLINMALKIGLKSGARSEVS